VLNPNVPGGSGPESAEGHYYRSEPQSFSNGFWGLRYLPIGDHDRFHQFIRIGLIDQSSQRSVQVA
jgi:hypothetical protein